MEQNDLSLSRPSTLHYSSEIHPYVSEFPYIWEILKSNHHGKDPTPPQTATEVLRIPFSSIIGGPLKACVEAQAEQAETTAKFIKEVGLDPDKEAEEKE